MTPSVVLLMRPADEPSGHPIVPRFLHLLDEGWDAHLVSIGGSGDGDHIPPEARARVHALAPAPPPAKGRLPRPIARRRRQTNVEPLPSLLRTLAPHLVHFPTTRSVFDWLQSPIRLGPARVVAGFSGADLDGKPYERLWNAASGFHFESETLADFARRAGLARATAAVVPPLADAGLLARPDARDREGTEVRMLSVGPLSWTQGYDHAIAAVRLLRDRGIACRYRILGEGEYEDAVAFARYQLGVEESVELVEPTGRRGLWEQLAWADLLVVSAVVPTSSQVVLDAQAAGLPVVTTELPPTGADTALVVPRRDAGALAGAVAQIAADPALRRRLASSGRRAANASQDLDDQLRRFRDLYRAVLA